MALCVTILLVCSRHLLYIKSSLYSFCCRINISFNILFIHDSYFLFLQLFYHPSQFSSLLIFTFAWIFCQEPLWTLSEYPYIFHQFSKSFTISNEINQTFRLILIPLPYIYLSLGMLKQYNWGETNKFFSKQTIVIAIDSSLQILYTFLNSFHSSIHVTRFTNFSPKSHLFRISTVRWTAYNFNKNK